MPRPVSGPGRGRWPDPAIPCLSDYFTKLFRKTLPSAAAAPWRPPAASGRTARHGPNPCAVRNFAVSGRGLRTAPGRVHARGQVSWTGQRIPQSCAKSVLQVPNLRNSFNLSGKRSDERPVEQVHIVSAGSVQMRRVSKALAPLIGAVLVGSCAGMKLQDAQKVAPSGSDFNKGAV